MVTSSRIEFRPLTGGRAYGYRAELLPKVCDVFLDAEKAKALGVNRLHIAAQAHILIRGLAHTGIAALADEATGYQEVRNPHALQAILDACLQTEFAAWANRFPDEFYEQMFRLRGWQWKGMKVNRPQVVGRYTNDLVYERLAPGVRFVGPVLQNDPARLSQERGNFVSAVDGVQGVITWRPALPRPPPEQAHRFSALPAGAAEIRAMLENAASRH